MSPDHPGLRPLLLCKEGKNSGAGIPLLAKLAKEGWPKAGVVGTQTNLGGGNHFHAEPCLSSICGTCVDFREPVGDDVVLDLQMGRPLCVFAGDATPVAPLSSPSSIERHENSPEAHQHEEYVDEAADIGHVDRDEHQCQSGD